MLELSAVKWWAKKRVARANNFRAGLSPKHDQLHLGCGDRHFPGWTNVDVYGSDLNLDLSIGKLPWKSYSFNVVLSQHVIEHLELYRELLPLLKETHRVMADGGKAWLSCPDLGKACEGYCRDNGAALLASIQSRHHGFVLEGNPPVQQVINYLFHQAGQHKNLFDFELLSWVLNEAGFSNVALSSEAELLKTLRGVEPRNDEDLSLYVVATK